MDYKKLYEHSQQENSILRDLLQDRMPMGCIAETTYQPILDENEKLEEELEELKGDHEELTKENQKLEKENDELDSKLSRYVFLAHKYTEDGSADQLREHLESVSRPHPSYMLQQ